MLRAPRRILPHSSTPLASTLFDLLHTRPGPFPHRSAVAAAAAALGSKAESTHSSRPPSTSCSSLRPRPMATDASPAPARTWEDVLNELSDLITFKTRADGKGWRDAFENMPVYLDVE